MKITKHLLAVATTFILIGVTMVGYMQTSLPVNAAPAAQDSSAMSRSITVIGEGRVRAQPDIAQVTIGVETVADDVQTAATEAEATMTSLMEVLTEQGIAETDIQTSNYSVYTDQFGAMEATDAEVTYRFSNNVTVIVRDLETIETVLGAVIEAGANHIHGVNFSIEDPSELRKQARAEAVNVAESKAAELAQLNDVEVGQVISISEAVDSMGPFYNSKAFSMAEGMGGGGPISPGELEFTVQLQISYAIQ